MRYAIISDIHANLEALLAVLGAIAGLRVDATFCLGDIVGYNANPVECIGVLRNEGISSVMGNHDSRAAGLEDADDFNPYAAEAVIWTRKQLSPGDVNYLQNLPRELQVSDLMLFHGSLHDTDRYIMHRKDILDNFHMLQDIPGPPRIGFFGHTHIRMAVSFDERTPFLDEVNPLPLREGHRYLINPGSVGQPRDGDPRAAFCVYDAEKGLITFHRTEYDIQACQIKIVGAGLPSRLAERLSMGR